MEWFGRLVYRNGVQWKNGKERSITSMVISERGTIRKGPGKERTKIDTGHFLVWCFRTCKQNP